MDVGQYSPNWGCSAKGKKVLIKEHIYVEMQFEKFC
jgi:hypothetical protein